MPTSAENNRLRGQARRQAWMMLQQKYPDDFAIFHDIARADLGMDPVQTKVERVHGTRSMYQVCTKGPDGGKCEPCTIANRDYQRGYMTLYREGIPWASPIDEYNGQETG